MSSQLAPRAALRQGAESYTASGFSTTTATPWPEPMHTPITP
ncbi:hypothetical protein L842_3310 [Mycobacterium intracellulare MIN_052511_1280]|nr:hypothetical protein L842_3310 [Mycobacterium intracellulare MIN_052511_1280]